MKQCINIDDFTESDINLDQMVEHVFGIPRVMFRISASLIFFLFNSMSAEKIPTIFIFGDSIVDVGNNNYINTLAKAMFPNGIDFCKNCLSGRFTNGRTVIDILEQRLGAKDFRPPYLAPNTAGDAVLRGVNYASSGSGILNDTGLIWKLYYLEARKIIVTNIPRFGCTPFERDKNPNAKGCIASFNEDISSYNKRLKRLLTDLTANLTASTFVYADIHAMLKDILQNYGSYGFENADDACCHKVGVHGGLLPCFSLSKICSNRTKYVFWDAFHLTEISNVIVASHMMDGGLKFMSPMNIRQLVYSSTVHPDD
ncbi:GDSL esterase/lipase At4g16230 isoform X2 [Gossypium hirsutum]|uniref:GDSL esterase/lipase At4g16230 isoform X2 n=1 Tax=Gossypium hirsutum TaxID=3635 RepID=A0ABM2YTZ5_GOSHI|nr:GDSL esterase/lipase At4g16230-like isoform X2 [Gossypium hirsutum]